MYTFDKRTLDATGVFLIGELERLDKTLHAPLSSVTWGRDMLLRSDVSLADEVSSFTNSTFTATGGSDPNGINWISGNSTAVSGIALDIGKTSHPMRLWGMELGYSIRELAAAQQVGRSIDAQKYEGLKLKSQMDIDQMVYVGDAQVGATGLLNNPGITPTAVGKAWATATPKQILDDINNLLNAAWEQTGFAILPTHLLVPPSAMARLTQPVTEAGSKSVLQYVREECLCNAINGVTLTINPVKWLRTAGASGKTRMVAYTKEQQFVRYPLVPLQHTPLEYRGLYQLTTYYGVLGEVEFVYPETVAYADGL